MNIWGENFWLFAIASALLFTMGMYCIMLSRNLIRVLIGVELLTKAVTLLLIVAGAVTGRMALAQALTITLIVIEVIAIAVAAGIVIGVHRQRGTVDAHTLRELKN